MQIYFDKIKIYMLEEENLSFYLDKQSHLYWKERHTDLCPLEHLPWKYQLPFYLKFLHNDDLAEKFKEMNIIGAIDVFIKHEFFYSKTSKH